MTQQKEKHKDTLWENVKALIYAIILAVLIRTFWLQPFHIPSGSMIPTLLIGDNLFVSKTAYGYSRFSIPFGGEINYFSGRIWAGEPKLGEIVVFRSVVEPNTDYIKRVVGLPGDRIQMKEGILYINDVRCPLEPHGEFKTVNDDGTVLVASQFVETLPNGLKHLIIKQVPFGEGTYDNTPVYHVPPGHYFMMGDNRDGSNDSRAQGVVGYIPFEYLVGRASFIFFSTGGHVALWEIWKWPFTAHYSRIFNGIH
ncbi:MAG: signal peptidase I [Alphaproteobacteria bacterium 41-28]|nr:MAG: signal peptidase I [Alphaproteobacteria bacterium 41-28]